MVEKRNNRALGTQKENIAAEFLQKQGYSIVQMNFRCKQGEIDIIATDEQYLVFAEVKYRADGHCGNPGEAIDFRKQKKIYRVAEYYLYSSRLPQDTPCRFDAVIIEGDNITLVKDAFGSIGS